jgi:acyl-coenzyme A thioesterase PaaI-like protein
MNKIMQREDTGERDLSAGDFHAECFACASTHEHGLHLQFESSGIQTTCRAEINKAHQSYDGVVHGGIIATLLDATMIRCLHSAFGNNPLTCRLDIRYREVVQIDTAVTVTACVTSRRGIHCWAHATIMQNERVCVTARGAFKLLETIQGRAI